MLVLYIGHNKTAFPLKLHWQLNQFINVFSPHLCWDFAAVYLKSLTTKGQRKEKGSENDDINERLQTYSIISPVFSAVICACDRPLSSLLLHESSCGVKHSTFRVHCTTDTSVTFPRTAACFSFIPDRQTDGRHVSSVPLPWACCRLNWVQRSRGAMLW